MTGGKISIDRQQLDGGQGLRACLGVAAAVGLGIGLASSSVALGVGLGGGLLLFMGLAVLRDDRP